MCSAHTMRSAIFFIAAAIALIQTILVLLGRNASQWTFYLIDQSPIPVNKPVLAPYFENRATHTTEPNWGVLMNMSSVLPVVVCVRTAWQRAETATPMGCLLRAHTMQKTTSVMEALNPHLILMAVAWGNCIFGMCETMSRPMSWFSGWKYVRTMIAIGIAVLVLVIDVVCRYVLNSDSADVLQYPTIFVQLLVILPCIYFAFKSDALGVEGHHTQNEHYHHQVVSAWKVAMHQQLIAVPLVITMIASMGMRLWTTVVCQTIFLSVAVNILWIVAMELCRRGIGRAFCIIITVGSIICIMRSSLGGPMSGWREVTGIFSLFALLPVIVLSVGKMQSSQRFMIEFCCVTATLMACVIDMGLLSSS